MEIIELPFNQLVEATWNSNQVDEAMLARLRASISKYGFVQNLVVRPIESGFEVLSGNQRLKVLREMELSPIPCVVVRVDDAHARLLAQALNHIHGEDDLGIRAEAIKKMLDSIGAEELLSILPETAVGLKSLAAFGQQPVEAYLQNWQQAKSARLRHLQFQLTAEQLEVVEKALIKLLPMARNGQYNNPNTRGSALYLLCKEFIDSEEKIS